VSNELGFQTVLPGLAARHPRGGVYLGVGPEQNFTYIAALQPAIAFVVDIRRANRDLHLLYKALFELASDRVEFLELLFSRSGPSGIARDVGLAQLFEAFKQVPSDSAAYERNLSRVRNHLLHVRSLPLDEDELHNVEYVYSSFHKFGSDIAYDSSANARLGIRQAPTSGRYVDLMLAKNADGEMNSFLSSDDRFATVKNMHQRNLLVPVVGNFAGPSALRGVGSWLKARGATVSVFYLSNVETYLRSADMASHFCQNVAALPIDDASEFIRTGRPVAPDSSGLRGSVEVRQSSTSAERVMVYFLSDRSGVRQEVTEDEYRKALPNALNVSSVGTLAELSKPCRTHSQR
jgi:hypothetical protein